MAKAKKQVEVNTDLSKTETVLFQHLAIDDYFLFLNTDVVQQKQDGGSSIDENGNVTRVPATTKVNHLYEYLKNQPQEEFKEDEEEDLKTEERIEEE